VPVVLYALLTGNSDLLYRVGRWGTKMAVWLAGVRLHVRGLEKMPRDRALVYMANHQGNCDPPALISVLPPVLVLVKKELFRIPVLGWGMRLCGYIPVDRHHPERALEAVEKAVEALRMGRSFLVFPEGTRSPDGRLQPFMAMKAAAPIVPVSVSGSSRIMRKGELTIHPGPLRITFHAPIFTEGHTAAQRGELMRRVRAAILSGLDEDEWPRLDETADTGLGEDSRN